MAISRCHLWVKLILKPLVSFLESRCKGEYNPPPEWGDEDQIEAYVNRLKDIETDSLNNICQTILKFSPWGIGISLAYIRLVIPEVSLTLWSWVFLFTAWGFWIAAFVIILFSFLFSGFFSWFNESVGLYRRFIAGMFWEYREKFYLFVILSLFLFCAGFASITVFAVHSAITHQVPSSLEKSPPPEQNPTGEGNRQVTN